MLTPISRHLQNAVGTWLQLQEAYGISESITTDTGLKVDGFRAILALELMKVFYETPQRHPSPIRPAEALALQQCVWEHARRNS